MLRLILLWIYAFLSVLFFTGLFLSFYDYSYAGYYSDKIIGWLWLAMGMAMIIVFWKRLFTKIITGSVIVLLLLSIIPMMVPFYSIVAYFSTIETRQQIALNKKYRIERSRRSPLGIEKIVIFENLGICERRVSATPWYDIPEKIIIPLPEYFFKANPGIEKASLQSLDKDSICIRYTITGTTGIFCHPLQ